MLQACAGLTARVALFVLDLLGIAARWRYGAVCSPADGSGEGEREPADDHGERGGRGAPVSEHAQSGVGSVRHSNHGKVAVGGAVT